MSKYVVIENTPGYLPEDDEPFVGSWDEACDAMEERIWLLIDQGYTVQSNEGVGFRTAGGIRRTCLLPPDPSEHTLSRVVEVIPAKDDPDSVDSDDREGWATDEERNAGTFLSTGGTA